MVIPLAFKKTNIKMQAIAPIPCIDNGAVFILISLFGEHFDLSKKDKKMHIYLILLYLSI